MRTYRMALATAWALAAFGARGQLLISEFLANPPGGDDSPLEYVELIATSDIDFAVNPYSVVFITDGPGTANGWIEGGGVTYGFSINGGSVMRGDVVYVGGSGMAPTGLRLREIDTGTTAGDQFGDADPDGVLGNGGGNADGIAIFAADLALLTPSLQPIDAIFYGEEPGNAVVSDGAEGYQLPVNDRYSGGKLQGSSFVAADPGSDETVFAVGAFDPDTGVWISPRMWTTGALSDGASGIAFLPVPEPSIGWLLFGGGLLGAWALRRRR